MCLIMCKQSASQAASAHLKGSYLLALAHISSTLTCKKNNENANRKQFARMFGFCVTFRKCLNTTCLCTTPWNKSFKNDVSSLSLANFLTHSILLLQLLYSIAIAQYYSYLLSRCRTPEKWSLASQFCSFFLVHLLTSANLCMYPAQPLVGLPCLTHAACWGLVFPSSSAYKSFSFPELSIARANGRIYFWLCLPRKTFNLTDSCRELNKFKLAKEF